MKLDSTQLPLHFADQTYNTAHPNFKFWMTGNYPGKIYTHTLFERLMLNFPHNLNWQTYKDLCFTSRIGYPELGTYYVLDRIRAMFDIHPQHSVLKKISAMSKLGCARKAVFHEEFSRCLHEITHEISHSKDVFANVAWMEEWISDLNDRSSGTYYPGWVGKDDAMFLYWYIRQTNPKVVVQTGVCNGLSSAYIAMALERNGAEGKLYAIDLTHIYDPNDPRMNEHVIYGVIIPEDKTSGWIIPESLDHRVEIIQGDAKKELPTLLDQLGEVDVFYHDSDHSYSHMMFEMKLVQQYLREGGSILCDDVSWNKSTWDFARENGYPAYNYEGSIGVVFM